MEVNFHEQMMNYLGENTLEPIYQEEVSEIMIPDSMPQVGEIVSCSGYICVQTKDADSSAVSVGGMIKACVLYQPADKGNLQKIEKEIAFTVKKEISELDPEHCVFYQGWVRRIDAKILGNSKLLIRANIGSIFTVYFPASFAVYTPLDKPKSLQLLKRSYELMLPSLCGEKEFQINEEAMLPQSATGINEILQSSAVFKVEETKAVGDKAVFKGKILLHFLYTSATGSLHVFDTELPFSQYAELNGESEDGDVRISILKLKFEAETDGQEESKRLFIGISALAQAVVYEKQYIDLFEDAYVTRGSLKAQWQDIKVQAKLDSQNISNGGEVSVPATTEKVIDATVYTDAPMLRRDADKLKVIMPVTANVIYLDTDGVIKGKESKGEIIYDNLLAQNASCVVTGAIYEQPVCLASYDTITVRMNVHVTLDSYMGSHLHTIKSADIEPAEKKPKNRPSLIARKVGSEAVWDIAKNYGSTVEAICEANGLTAGVVQEGTILLIPMQ